MSITLTTRKSYFIPKYLFSIHFAKHYGWTPSASCFGNSYIVVASPSVGSLNVIHLPTYAYPACLLTTTICSLISLYIVNHKECFKIKNNNQLIDRSGNMHSDQFVFKRVASYFLQTSCCLVGSPGELYPRVHKSITNLTCMFWSCILT